MGGGRLLIQGKAGTTNSQRLNGVAINPGSSAVVLTAGVSNPLLLSMGSLSRSPGGTVDFTLPSGTQSATNGITTTTPNTAAGILGGYATVGGTNWATWNGADIVAYAAYTNGNLATLSSSNTQNIEPSGAQTAVTSAESFNTLNLTGALSVTMSSAGALTLAGGGLIGNTSGSISGGTLAGSASGELIVITPANLTIGSVIADNGGATALTKGGAATLTLTGSNTYSGATTVGAGTLQIGNGGSGEFLSSPSVTLFNGAALVFNHSDSLTYSGAIGGQGGLIKASAGTLTITNANTFGGVDSAGDTYGIVSIHQGAINVSPGGVLTNNTSEIDVGDTAGQTGTLIMSSGTAFVPFGSKGDSGVNVGVHGGKGLLTLTGNSLLDATATNLYGTVSGNWYNVIDIGLFSGSAGTVTVAGVSTLRANNGPFNNLGLIAVGDGGTGSLTIQDQGLVQAGTLTLGSEYQSGQAGGAGTLNLIGSGQLAANVENVGDSGGTGSFTQSGGLNTCNYGNLGNGVGTSGTYSLNGGAPVCKRQYERRLLWHRVLCPVRRNQLHRLLAQSRQSGRRLRRVQSQRQRLVAGGQRVGLPRECGPLRHGELHADRRNQHLQLSRDRRIRGQ